MLLLAAGCALIPVPSQSVPAGPRPQLVMAWLCVLLWPTRRVSPTPSGVRLGAWLGSACPRCTCITPAQMLLLLLLHVLLLLLAVLSFQCRHSQFRQDRDRSW